ncbi:hypothetical protein HQN87_18595 [Paenibacillus tritici]|uniref:LPXTG cell wall anchor domain-containing protein n=2 Tax=Paenibacillus tritici TaxID=1873425 RepID=A0ABX2DSF8_9BACL|nr:hypothetical protein [Paenibacillus tritici]
MFAIRKIRGVMLMLLCALMVFITLLTVRPQVTYACSCVMPAPPLEAMEKSAAIFEGTVVRIEEEVKPMQSSMDPVSVTFQVGSRWKGEVGEQVTVTTALSDASCGFEFTEGERYMVYASGEEAEGNGGTTKLTVSLCSRTALFSGAQEDLNALGAGMSGGSPTEPPGIPDDQGAVSGNHPTSTNHPASENNPTTEPETTSASWLPYAGAGAGIIVLGTAALILLRRQSNSRK